MFTVKDGKIVITSESALLSKVYTPEEWNAEMLRLLDERQMALNNKAIVKAEDEQVAFPARPDSPTIWGYVMWKADVDKATAVADVIDKKLKKYNAEIATLEAQIVHLMPEGVKLCITDDEKPGAYSVWWTRRYDSEGVQQTDLRIETLKHLARVTPAPETIPLSQQLEPDEMAFGFDAGDEDCLWDDEEEIGGVPSEYSGENDEPPAPVNPDDIPF